MSLAGQCMSVTSQSTRSTRSRLSQRYAALKKKFPITWKVSRFSHDSIISMEKIKEYEKFYNQN